MRIYAYFLGIDDDDNPCKEHGTFFLVLHSSTPQTGVLVARRALRRRYHLRASAIRRKLHFQQGTPQLKVVASIMALDRCLRNQGEPQGSVYDERGLLVF